MPSESMVTAQSDLKNDRGAVIKEKPQGITSVTIALPTTNKV